jgi:hypothetical protein
MPALISSPRLVSGQGRYGQQLLKHREHREHRESTEEKFVANEPKNLFELPSRMLPSQMRPEVLTKPLGSW